jgi:acyl-CoA synthetase (NDP forming)
MVQGSLDFLFYPKSIAVVGASNNPESHGHNHLKFQLNYGYKGALYPINPSQDKILGLKAYPGLEAVPGTIDHVKIAVAISNVPDILKQASRKGVRSMHIYSGRASETGRPEAKKLDEEILSLAKEFGIRIIGPNALGLFCPESGISLGFDYPPEQGYVGAIMQSGANTTNLCHIALLRGVKFSKVASYGNGLDISEADLLDYLGDDPKTRFILLYNEGLRCEPERFLELVRKAARNKPVIICKGGRSKSGARFTKGHNASNSVIGQEIWGEPIREAGAVMVNDIDELLDMAVAFSQLPPIKGNKVGAGGGGGGDCTIYTDAWEENGFELPPLPQGIRDEFRSRGSQVWDWINNPADFSMIVPNDAYTGTAALMEMAKHPDFDFIVAYVGEDYPFNVDTLKKMTFSEIEGYIKVFKGSKKPFFAIVRDRPLGLTEMDGERWRAYAQARTRFLQEGVPFFTSFVSAAKAISRQMNYYQKKG